VLLAAQRAYRAEHVRLAEHNVEIAVFKRRSFDAEIYPHGAVFGAPMGEPAHAYFAEWEFADDDAFQAAAQSPEFMATGKDAYKRGWPMPAVEFVRVS